MKVCINEIFVSLSGEPDGWNNRGGLATFIRFQGCNLNCSYCDTKYAISTTEGTMMPIHEVLAQVKTKHVIITGGEPLLQRDAVMVICGRLGNRGHLITIETNGTRLLTYYTKDVLRVTYPISRVRWVVDYKLCVKDLMEEVVFECLDACDVIKFVLRDEEDYKGAIDIIKHRNWKAQIVFSPVINVTTNKGLFANSLANWLIRDRFEGVTMSPQLHKLLGIR